MIGPYNSSVGIANLALYRRNRVLPLWMTSRDETAGAGATVQPMNSQIAPVERAYVKRIGARRIAMLVDDTANGAFTKGMANRLRAALRRDGASVTLDVDPGDDCAGAPERLLRGAGRERAGNPAGSRLREHVLPRGSGDREGADCAGAARRGA